MKLSNKYKAILQLLLIICVCVCESKIYSQHDIRQQEVRRINVLERTDGNYIKCRSDDSLFCTSIEFHYMDSTILIMKQNDTIIKVPYYYNDYSKDYIFTLGGLVTSDDSTTYNYYIYDNQFLLLPLNGISGITGTMNLIIIDLSKNKYLTFVNSNNYLMPTHRIWYLDKENNYIIGTSPFYPEPEPEEKTSIVYYKIVDENVIVQKSKLVFLNVDISEDYRKFRKAIGQ